MSSPCQNLDRFVDDELTAAEAAEFRSHLHECPRCRVCESLDRLVDGELSGPGASAEAIGEADAFRAHLGGCARCQHVLEDRIQLAALGEELARRQGYRHNNLTTNRQPSAVPGDTVREAVIIPLYPRPAAHNRSLLLLTAGLLAVASLVVMLKRRPDSPPPTLAISLGPLRPLESRLAYPLAKDYRPYDPARGQSELVSPQGHMAGMEAERNAGRPRAPLVAGAPSGGEAISPALLMALEKRGDYHGLAIAYLLDGHTDQRIEVTLSRAPDSADTRNDRAVLLLAQRRYAEALAVLDGILDESPLHLPALWNRGLAASAINLPFTAAEDFDRVAAAGEPGWSEEAAGRARGLREEAVQRKERYTRSARAGADLLRGRTAISNSNDMVMAGVPDILRLYFYDAVRSAGSTREVAALAPLAHTLDATYQGPERAVLSRYVATTKRTDFRQRKLLAATYRDLATGGRSLDSRAIDRYLAELQRAGQDDLLLGALVWTRRATQESERYSALARATGDPWFALLAGDQRADMLLERGDYAAAEAVLVGLRQDCRSSALHYRCARVDWALAELYVKLHRLAEAEAVAAEGLARTRAHTLWPTESALLATRLQAARFRGQLAVTRAYAREIVLREDAGSNVRCRAEQYGDRALAELYTYALDAGRARRALDAQRPCGPDEALRLIQGFTLANLARMAPRVDDAVAVPRMLAELDRSGVTPGEALYADHIRGRALIALVGERDRARALLEQVIATADTLPGNEVDGDKARAYSYASLIMDAAARGEFDQVMRLLARELGVNKPAACAVGMAVDFERSALVMRDGQGQIHGRYTQDRQLAGTGREDTGSGASVQPTSGLALLDASTLIPPAWRAELSSCPVIDVLARPPLFGAVSLPPELAWRFLHGPLRSTGSGVPGAVRAARPAAQGRLHSLIIADPAIPPALALPALAPWRDRTPIPGEESTVLRREAATPEAALLAMPHADIIEIHSHGLVDAGIADATALVLARGASGWALTTRQITGLKLDRTPLVILAACDGASATPSFHQAWGLPLAFLTAGARAVIASPGAVGDASAAVFFERVRQRIAAGELPAVAVRNERTSAPPTSWQRNVVVFE